MIVLLGYVLPATIVALANWHHGRKLYLADTKKLQAMKIAREQYRQEYALYRDYQGDDEHRPHYPFTGSEFYYNPTIRRYHILKWVLQSIIPVANIGVAICRILWDYNIIGWVSEQFRKPLVPSDE